MEQNKLISKKQKKVCTTLNYIKHLLVLAFTITECISISVFASLLGIRIGMTSSAIGLKICAIAAGIKKYKSIIQKKKIKDGQIVLLAKSKLNNIEVLTSKSLLDSNISRDEFILVNNVLEEYDKMKKGIKNLKT